MRTVAITHKIYEGNVDPFTQDHIDQLLQESRIAIGTNWRGRTESDWANNKTACEEFRIFDRLASEGGFVIANYQGLPPNTRIIGRVTPTATGKPTLWNKLRMLSLAEAKQVDTVAEEISDLQVLPGRTIVDITARAGDRISKLLPNVQRDN